MKNLRIAVVLVAGVATLSPGLHGQNTQKPSSYSGVSQPPPDDTITTDTPATTTSGTPTTPSPTLETRPAPSQATPPPPSTPAAAAPAMTTSNMPAAKAPCNSEDRMIGDPDPCVTPAVEVVQQPKSSPYADDGIVTSVPTRPGELPEGTVIKIALDQEIATGQSTVGSDFSGRVAADVVSLGKVAIPQGAQVVGKVVQVTEGHRFGSPATIRLRPDVVVLPDGTRYVLRAQLIQTSTKSRLDSEGTLKPASRMKTNVIKEAAGIGTGAVVGAVVGGPTGALVGSLIGAGVMTTNILVQHPADVKIPKDSTLVLSLTQPMSISPEVASVAPGGSN